MSESVSGVAAAQAEPLIPGRDSVSADVATSIGGGIIVNLQVLRAVAALLVLGAHFHQLLAPIGIRAEVMYFGGAGVDLFFVISGFVMVHTIARRPQRATHFLINRVIRVVPLYWLVTFGLCAAVLAVPESGLAPRMIGADLFKSLFFVPIVQDGRIILPLLFVGWTLQYEMFFYAMFAVALALAAGRGRLAGRVTGALLALLAIAGLILPLRPELAFYADPILLEFVMGMVIAQAYLRGWHVPRPVSLALVGLGFVVLIGDGFFAKDLHRALTFGGPSMAIVAGAVVLERDGKVLSNPVLNLIGASSFALYLTHPFAVALAVRLVGNLRDAPINALLLAPAMCFAVAVAIAVHIWVERPMTDRLRRWAGHKPPITEAR